MLHERRRRGTFRGQINRLAFNFKQTWRNTPPLYKQALTATNQSSDTSAHRLRATHVNVKFKRKNKSDPKPIARSPVDYAISMHTNPIDYVDMIRTPLRIHPLTRALQNKNKKGTLLYMHASYPIYRVLLIAAHG